MSAFWYAEPSQGLWISVQAVWVEGNDLRAFQNIPMAGFGAKAPAPVGESLERCFRAQRWCYHIVSGLNGLPTVCLKVSHNDRDQLITAFACTLPSDPLMDELMPLRLNREAAGGADAAPCTVRGLHSYFKLTVLKKKKEKKSVQTWGYVWVKPPKACMCKHSLPAPSPVSCHLCAKQVCPKDRLVPEPSVARGGALMRHRSGHAQQSEASPGLPSRWRLHNAVLTLDRNAALFTAHTQRHMRGPVTFTWKVFSQSGPQTSLTTMNWPVKPSPVKEVVEEEEKNRTWGMSKLKSFVFLTSIKESEEWGCCQ